MVFGYTPLDPLVVLWGTLLAIWYLQKAPVKLIGFMPTALSLWFFVPFVTNLTLWQIVPLLLTGRMLLKGGWRLPKNIQTVTFVLMIFFATSAIYAVIFGEDGTRAILRIIYYVGILAIFSFAYEMGRRPETYEILLRGLVLMGGVYAIYGAYQIVAFYTGLPLRGIVYNASGESIMAFEGGLLRINSFANEPKRLGYVLFVAAMACVFLARMRPIRRKRQLRWAAIGIFGISIMTFAGSYFVSIMIFGLGTLFLYPSQATKYLVGALMFFIGITIIFPDIGITQAIQSVYESRSAELEIGLDGFVVYRQEFFAWDYLLNNVFYSLIGVGVGQYNSVLHKIYGVGAGFNSLGGLLPLNSNFLELVFDLGLIAAAIIYGGLIILIIRLHRIGEAFFSLNLLFLVVQSLTILNFLFVAFFAGIAIGRLVLHSKEESKDNYLSSVLRKKAAA